MSRLGTRGQRLWMLWVLLGVLAALCAAALGCGDDDDDSGDDDDDDDDDDDERTQLLDRDPDVIQELPGLTAPVRVARDQYDIPYIFAENREDLMLVLGYVHALERFYEMDFFRTVGSGRLSEWIGSAGLDSDFYYRHSFMMNDGTSVLDAIEADMDDGIKGLIQKYADGINLWLGERQAAGRDDDWPAEYSFPIIDLRPADVPDWTVRDTIAYVRLQTEDLSGSLGAEIGETEAAAMLPPALYDLMYSHQPATETVILPGAATKSRRPAHDADRRAQLAHMIDPTTGAFRYAETIRTIEGVKEMFRFSDPLGASNNWIVSPDLGGGTGIVANDPHLSLYTPSIWMLGLMDVSVLGPDDEVRVWGAMFPATNMVAIGANRNMAWGETVVGYDVQDVYEESVTFDDDTPVSVEYEGGDVDLIVSPQEFVLGHGIDPTTETIDFYVVPHHGPIIPDSIDSGSGTALSHRWTGQQVTQEVYAFSDLADATNVSEGMTALDNFGVGGQNFVMQDTSGDMAYYPHAIVPTRSGDLDSNPPWLILPGDGSVEWDGTVPDDELPQSLNPERGWLATANNDIDGALQDGNPLDGGTTGHYLAGDRAIGYRAQRIHEQIEDVVDAKGEFTADDAKTLQTDTQLNYARDIVTASLDALGDDVSDLSDDGQAVVALFEDWDFVADTGLTSSDPTSAASSDETAVTRGVAAMVFAQFEYQLKMKVMADEFADAGATFSPGRTPVSASIKRLMLGESTNELASTIFDDVSTEGTTETKRDCVAAAIEAALADLAAMDEFDGLTLDQYLWGRKHHLVMNNPFPGIALLTDDFNLGPYAIPGGLYSVNVANYDADGESFTVGHGPSLRTVHEIKGDDVVSYMIIPGGTSGIRGSEHQTDLLDIYLDLDYLDFPTKVPDILAVTETMFEYQPAE